MDTRAMLVAFLGPTASSQHRQFSIDVGVWPQPLGRGVLMLIGRDLLTECRFHYDGKSGTFRLETD